MDTNLNAVKWDNPQLGIVLLSMIAGFVLWDHFHVYIGRPSITVDIGLSHVLSVVQIAAIVVLSVIVNKKHTLLAAKHARNLNDDTFTKKYLSERCEGISKTLYDILEASSPLKPDYSKIHEMAANRLDVQLRKFLAIITTNAKYTPFITTPTGSEHIEAGINADDLLNKAHKKSCPELLNLAKFQEREKLRTLCWAFINVMDDIHFIINNTSLSKMPRGNK